MPDFRLPRPTRTAGRAQRSALVLLLAGAVLGIGALGVAHEVLEYTDSDAFCGSCHVMRATVFEEFEESIHANNPSGIRATCADCHIPRPLVPHLVRKVEATQFLVAWLMGTDTPEELLAKREELAELVWARMRANDSAACRHCHQMDHMDLAAQSTRARTQHEDARETGETCIDCHDDGVAHEPVKVEAPPEETDFTL